VDVGGAVAAGLDDRERRQRGADHHDGTAGNGGCLGIASVTPNQPAQLRHDDEHGEVVGGQRQRCGERPAAPVLAQQAPQRECAQRHEQRVGAGLLAVPDEQRVGSRQGRCGERGAVAGQAARDQREHDDRRGAEDRRE
jgi:hypothetical protein